MDMAKSIPNILFVLTDQHSFRHLGYRDSDRQGEPVQTPTLDRLASNSVAFQSAYCASPLCTPSRYSLLTGKEAARAGGWNNWSVLNPNLKTLPETLSEAGYETCLQGKMHLSGDVQFAGFDHRPYGDMTGMASHQAEPPEPYNHPPDYRRLLTEVGETAIPESLLQEQVVVQETVSFLREQTHRNPSDPWFLCASFSRPHWPRTAPSRFVDRYWSDEVPEPKVGTETDTAEHPLVTACAELTTAADLSREEMMRARAGYFAAVDYIDEIVGDLLSRLEDDGLLEDTIVVYASDHGELAGEHGLWEKRTWHEASTRVPLLVQLPEHRTGEKASSEITTPVNLIDLYPTLCGLVGAEPPDDLDGQDLSSSITAGEEPPNESVVVDCFGMFGNEALQYRMIREGDYKYVQFRDAPEVLFNLEDDPLERTNLIESDREEVEATLDRLRSYVTDSIDFEENDMKRERDAKMAEEHRLATPDGGPNQYHIPGESVFEADTALYHPHVTTNNPKIAFDDYPYKES